MFRSTLATACIIAMYGCTEQPQKPAGKVTYQISGPAGVPVVVEYYGVAGRIGTRRYAAEPISKEVVLPRDGVLRFWVDADAGGTAVLTALNKDPKMGSCVELAILVDERVLAQDQACLQSYTSTVRAVIPAAS
jgi:hypothetical protein